MAISLADSLAIKNRKQNVERDSFLLLSDMIGCNPNYLPDIFIATCKETGKLYLYNVDNEVSEETGKWREVGGAALSDEDIAKLQKIGNWEDITIESVNNIVEALNKLNNSELGSFSVVNQTLNVIDKTGTIIQTLDLAAVASTIYLENLKNVKIIDVQDKDRLVYDAAAGSWSNKPDDILPAAKQYTDDEIAKLDRRSVIPVDEKPSQEDADLDVVYVYSVDDTWYQTVYVKKSDDTIKEITEKYLGAPNFDDYVHKINDTIDTYSEIYSDETKIPTIKLISELQSDINAKIGEKISTEDIVDDLESEDADKPLAASQGKALKELIEASSGGIFEEEMGTTATIGGLAAGTVVKDWSDHKVLQKILFPYVKPGAKLTISPATVLYKIGSVVEGLVLTCVATKNSEPLTSIKFLKGDVSLEEKTEGVAAGGTFIHVLENSITTNTTLKSIVSDGQSNVESSVSIKFVNPIYYGCSKATLTEKLMEKGKFTYDNITCNNDSVVFKYDATWGNLKSILDASSFESINSFTKSQEVINGTTYNVYTLTIPATLSGFKYTFSF